MLKREKLEQLLADSNIDYQGFFDLDANNELQAQTTINYPETATELDMATGDALLARTFIEPVTNEQSLIKELESRLRNSAVWAHVHAVMGAGNMTILRDCNILINALSTWRTGDDLVFAWNTLRANLQASSLDDFSQAHLDFLDDVLIDIGLELPGLDLTPPT